MQFLRILNQVEPMFVSCLEFADQEFAFASVDPTPDATQGFLKVIDGMQYRVPVG
jgi:hypothetical protein